MFLTLLSMLAPGFAAEVVVDRFGNEKEGYGLADAGRLHEGDSVDLTVRMDEVYGFDGDWGTKPSNAEDLAILNLREGKVALLPGIPAVLVWNPMGNAVAVRRADEVTAPTPTETRSWTVHVPPDAEAKVKIGATEVVVPKGGDVDALITAQVPGANVIAGRQGTGQYVVIAERTTTVAVDGVAVSPDPEDSTERWSPKQVEACTVDPVATAWVRAAVPVDAPNATVVRCPVDPAAEGKLVEIFGTPASGDSGTEFWSERESAGFAKPDPTARRLRVTLVQGVSKLLPPKETRSPVLEADLSQPTESSHRARLDPVQGLLYLEIDHTPGEDRPGGPWQTSSVLVGPSAARNAVAGAQLGYGVVARDEFRSASAALMVTQYKPDARWLGQRASWTAGLRFGSGDAVLGILGGVRVGYPGWGVTAGFELGTEHLDMPWHFARDYYVGLSFDPTVIQAMRRENQKP